MNNLNSTLNIIQHDYVVNVEGHKSVDFTVTLLSQKFHPQMFL